MREVSSMNLLGCCLGLFLSLSGCSVRFDRYSLNLYVFLSWIYFFSLSFFV